MSSVIGPQLTAEQRRAVEEVQRPVRITGGAGTGKTTTLLAHYQHLLRRYPASSILVVCRNREAATRLLDAVLPGLAGGFDALPVTTFGGLAYDVVSRYGGAPQLLTGAEQRRLVRELLTAEGPAEWPTLHHLLARRAFAAEVSAGVVALRTSLVGDDEVRSRAEAAGVLPRWRELAAFHSRYTAAMARAGVTDHAGLLFAASIMLERSDVTDAERGRFTHVLVDDYETAAPAADRLLTRLVGLGARPVVAGDLDAASGGAGWARRLDPVDVGLTRSFRSPSPAVAMHCSHPAVEPEAVAGTLLDARERGVAWHDMAVLVRTPGERARGIARALARHGIPVAPMPGPVAAEPVVASVADMLRWVGGDDRALDRLLTSPVVGLDPAHVRDIRRDVAAGGMALHDHPELAALTQLRDDLKARVADETPAELSFEVWRRNLGHLAAESAPPADDRALDALVSYCDGLRRRAERHPEERLAHFLASDGDGAWEADPWRSGAAPSREVVTVTPISAAAGREWHTVVVAGCLEGELPRVRSGTRFFDPTLLGRPVLSGDLHHERRLFATACSRATGRLIGSVAPEPGVLVSRFVAGWPACEPSLPLAPGPELLAREPTEGEVPATGDGSLRLSASQLATYDDCPLRYSYRYVLGARDEGGVRAGLGSLVHEVLAAFLDPDEPSGFPRTREGLLALGEQRWRDDVARYRPQVEEARRDFFAMLERWWDGEGSQEELAPEVLAVERRFEVEVGPHRLTGAIDRVDRADDGSGIRIVDYKTGKAEPVAERVADDLQLAVYHLAAARDPELTRLGRPTQLRLLYLRTMHCYEQPVAADHEAVTEARVLERAAHIRAEHFEPSVDATCRTCSFQRLCPLHDEGRQLG